MSTWKDVLHQHLVPSARNAYRPHLLRPSWLGFFIAIILAAEGFLVTNLIVRQSNENFLAAVVPGEVIALTNADRATIHKGALQENTLLDAAAQAKANDMAKKEYFSHTSPDGKTPWDWIAASGYTYQYAGENLAVNFTDAQDVLHAWIASPSHRGNLENPVYTDIGIGVANGTYEGEPATFVVQYLASPAIQSAAVANTHIDTVLRFLARMQANPLSTTQWILGSVVILLTLLLAIAIIRHIELQSWRLIATAGAVCTVAIFLWVSNNTFLEAVLGSSQSASVLMGTTQVREGSVLIPSTATSTARG